MPSYQDIMQFLLNIISNDWFVGIVCGVLSGLIVAPVGTWIYRKKTTASDANIANRANSEIIHVLKLCIAEGGVPDGNIVRCLINSNSRRYEIPVNRMYGPEIIREELIGDIMSDEYIKVNDKLKLIDSMPEFSVDDDLDVVNEYIESNRRRIEKEYRQRIINQYITVIMAFYFAVVSVFVVRLFYGEFDLSDKLELVGDGEITLLISVFAGFVAVLGSFMSIVIVKKGRRKIDRIINDKYMTRIFD